VPLEIGERPGEVRNGNQRSGKKRLEFVRVHLECEVPALGLGGVRKKLPMPFLGRMTTVVKLGTKA
jgi:hypothetical protein